MCAKYALRWRNTHTTTRPPLCVDETTHGNMAECASCTYIGCKCGKQIFSYIYTYATALRVHLSIVYTNSHTRSYAFLFIFEFQIPPIIPPQKTQNNVISISIYNSQSYTQPTSKCRIHIGQIIVDHRWIPAGKRINAKGTRTTHKTTANPYGVCVAKCVSVCVLHGWDRSVCIFSLFGICVKMLMCESFWYTVEN